MVAFYNIKNITPGPASRSSAHEAYLNAVYHPPNESPRRIIYKKNKYGLAHFSRLEAEFGQLAHLLLLSNLTSSQNLVVDDKHNVLGLAVQHLIYVIENKEGLDKNFYTLQKPEQGGVSTPLKANNAAEIPYYFFNELPQGFFARLLAAKDKGLLTLDYDSLASILATSYTLEEDDLHRGNYGFYLVEKAGKPHVVFFKIDHDLMFVNSIMVFHTRRPFHLIHGAHAFDITADDLLSLVCLKDSANSYWPTKYGYISNPLDKKEYRSQEDIDAFTRLSGDGDFIAAKWKSFLKHILMPEQLIKQTLKEHANVQKASERAQIALITQATMTRLARLRAALFSIKDFRDYVGKLDEEQIQAFLQEVIPPQFMNEQLAHEVRQYLGTYQKLCRSNHGFEPGDTPLHTAIKLGQYRYEETLSMFGQFIHVKNRAGKTPLDMALKRYQSNTQRDETGNAQNDACLIMKHLLKHGAQKTLRYRNSGVDPIIKAYRFKNPYLEGITAGMRYSKFKRILRDIGEDSRFGLKFKKNLARACVKHFIKLNEDSPHFENTLLRLKIDLNGDSSEEEAAGMKYIRQLRSKLWIIRQLRGIYGLTSTLWELNSLIDQARERIKDKQPHCFSFFYCADKATDSRDDEQLSHDACTVI